MQSAMYVWLAVMAASTVCAAKVTINEAEFRDKVYACWLGKSIGGTLGMPVEGSRSMHTLTFFDPIPEKQLPNDDLDLQLLWLKALQERGTDINARILGEYWLKYVPVDWNEYGIGKMNMKRGILPPVSGQYANNKWRDSNGAWIRSEIWACVAPGCPSLAARYAYEDASVDHGGAEGTFAEVFTATVESAAFVESDIDKLLDIGLSYIPKNCETALCIRTARDAKKQGLDLVSAHELLLKTGKTDWFMAPRNVAYVVLGWLYGEGDFGKSICTAVNFGDDTDCTGATLGSILGIIHGSKFIPDNWRKPVGESITNVAISGSNPPGDLKDLTDQTVAMAKQVLSNNKASVMINDGPTDRNAGQRLKLTDSKVTKELWNRTPYQLIYKLRNMRFTLDIHGDPEIKPDTPLHFDLILENSGNKPADVTANWRMDSTVIVTPLTLTANIPSKSRMVKTYKLQLVPGNEKGMTHGTLDITLNGSPAASIPVSLVHPTSVSVDDLALAKRGAKATSDSELDRESGCTAKAIDGIINSNEFEANRWHSSITTPHPHWIAVELPVVKSIRKCIIHFADPEGHPVDFHCEISQDGNAWKTVAEEIGYTDRNRYEKNIDPIECKIFKLTITKSANPSYPNAAQIAEIELLP